MYHVGVYAVYPDQERDQRGDFPVAQAEVRHPSLRRPYLMGVSQEAGHPCLVAVTRNLRQVRRVVTPDAQNGVAVVAVVLLPDPFSFGNLRTQFLLVGSLGKFPYGIDS